MLDLSCDKEVFIVILAHLLSFGSKCVKDATAHVVGFTSASLDHARVLCSEPTPTFSSSSSPDPDSLFEAPDT
jgi:hypothetical protein